MHKWGGPTISKEKIAGDFDTSVGVIICIEKIVGDADASVGGPTICIEKIVVDVDTSVGGPAMLRIAAGLPLLGGAGGRGEGNCRVSKLG